MRCKPMPRPLTAAAAISHVDGRGCPGHHTRVTVPAALLRLRVCRLPVCSRTAAQSHQRARMHHLRACHMDAQQHSTHMCIQSYNNQHLVVTCGLMWAQTGGSKPSQPFAQQSVSTPHAPALADKKTLCTGGCVAQQHGDGHRANTPWHRRDCACNLTAAAQLTVSHQSVARLLAGVVHRVGANVNDNRARFDPGALHRSSSSSSGCSMCDAL